MILHKPTLIILREELKLERLKAKKSWLARMIIRVPILNRLVRSELRAYEIAINEIEELIYEGDLMGEELFIEEAN